MTLGFRPPRDAARNAALVRLKASAARLFNANEQDAVPVNELQCSEPGCPPTETVVALLRAGRPRGR